MGYWDRELAFASLVGKTLTSVNRIGDEEIIFHVDDGKSYKLYHLQDCCENVTIDDIEGDLDDLVGSPIIRAEEVSNSDSINPEVECESFTWTFYKLATIKGYVDIRWFGSSNGYYSESVNFREVTE